MHVQTFLMTHLIWVILISLACLLLIIGIGLLHSFLVSQRLHFLAQDVVEHGPETFQHSHVITCHTCKSKRHVSHYRYGRGTTMKTVYLCYLCMPRFEQHLRDVSPLPRPTPIHQEAPKDASYAQFQAWTEQDASPVSSIQEPSRYRVPQHRKRG